MMFYFPTGGKLAWNNASQMKAKADDLKKFGVLFQFHELLSLHSRKSSAAKFENTLANIAVPMHKNSEKSSCDSPMPYIMYFDEDLPADSDYGLTSRDRQRLKVRFFSHCLIVCLSLCLSCTVYLIFCPLFFFFCICFWFCLFFYTFLLLF